MWGILPFCLVHWQFLSWRRSWIWCFFCVDWNDHVVFVLDSWDVRCSSVVCKHWFTLYFWDKSHWIVMYDLFDVVLDLICYLFCWESLCLFSLHVQVSGFLLHCVFYYGFKVMLASEQEFGRVPSCPIFWNTLKSVGVTSSLNIL